jgi:hypothetical protein
MNYLGTSEKRYGYHDRLPSIHEIDQLLQVSSWMASKHGRPTLFAQRMKGESGFLGLLYPPAKKLLNNMLCFPRALLIKKKALYINYIVYPIIYDQ